MVVVGGSFSQKYERIIWYSYFFEEEGKKKSMREMIAVQFFLLLLFHTLTRLISPFTCMYFYSFC